MELNMMRRRGSSSHLYIIFLLSLSLLTHRCVEARISRQHFFKVSSHHNSKLKQLKHIGMDDLPNPQSYAVGSPFNLPPFDSLAPTPLPQPFCDESPPGLTPLPPSTTTPPTTAYTPPPPPFYLPPLLPYQSPPQSPPVDVPNPPETSPMIPTPPYSFPSPPESSPITPSPPQSIPTPVGGSPTPILTPPEYSSPSPPVGSPTPILTPPEYSSPSPPYTIPNPPVYMPSPPSGNEPSPPVYTPGPPGYEPGPPMYVPSPYIYTPNPPSGSYVPNPPSGGYVPNPPSGGEGFIPSPAVFQPPDVFPPPTVPPSPFHKGQGLILWCVAKPSVPDPIIEEAMNYACGSGAECTSIQPQGSCYRPENLLAHASYAFNSYWQRTKAAGGTCDFGGTAILVTIDPSFDGCHFITT